MTQSKDRKVAIKPPPSIGEAGAMLAEATYKSIQHDHVIGLRSMAPNIKAQLDQLAVFMHSWFSGVQGFDRDNFDGDCMLVNTELAEAVEADRADAQSDKIPGFHGREEEVADALVRVLHLAGKYKIRLGEAFIAKMEKNLERPYKHGKRY